MNANQLGAAIALNIPSRKIITNISMIVKPAAAKLIALRKADGLIVTEMHSLMPVTNFFPQADFNRSYARSHYGGHLGGSLYRQDSGVTDSLA